jgi:hypothetical protein
VIFDSPCFLLLEVLEVDGSELLLHGFDLSLDGLEATHVAFSDLVDLCVFAAVLHFVGVQFEDILGFFDKFPKIISFHE